MNHHLGTRKLSIPSLSCLGALALLMACGPKSAEPVKPAVTAEAKAPAKKVEEAKVKPVATPKAQPAPAPAAYTIRVVPGSAKAGAEITSLIEIAPLPGYKMNKDFPSRLKLAPSEGVTVNKPVLNKGDADLSEAMLRFKVPFVASAAGTTDMSGTADFSVCNESSCKLYRGEQISWKVAVQ